MSPSEVREASASQSTLSTIVAAVESVEPEKGYTPDRARQQSVLTRIPDTFILELAAHRFASDIEQKFHQDRLGLPHTEQDEKMLLRGKIFEMLVAADPRLYTPSQVADELLALLHDPDRFGLGESLGYPRNPDMAFLVVEEVEGALLIKAAGECKLGRLNARGLKQLDGGFLRGIEKAMQILNELGDLQRHGLVALGQAQQHCSKPQFLRLAPDFRIILADPANRDTDDPDALIKTEELTGDQRSRLQSLLGDEKEILIQQAAFSAAEVAAITQALIDVMSLSIAY